MKAIAIALCGSVLLMGCVSLSPSEREAYASIKARGLADVNEVSPGAAGGLNLLPGFGNFYLGIAGDEGSQWLFGFLNLLTWPISIVWGVPEGIIDANTINKRATVHYYKYGEGKTK